MIHKEFNIDAWGEIGETGDPDSGYVCEFLGNKEGERSDLLFFRDERERLHLAIEDGSVSRRDLPDPRVHGLKVDLKRYKFRDTDEVRQYIDIKCSHRAYIKEFTEIVKEIAEKILEENEDNITAVSSVIDAWKSFWKKQIKETLSEDDQVGLICELIVLKKLCEHDLHSGIDSWKGPLGEKHDFVFPDQIFEVKGTRREGHIHTINGLDQLKAPSGKSLAVISFLATRSNAQGSKSLQDLVEDLEERMMTHPEAINRFHELLADAGYSRVHSEEYSRIKFDVYDGRSYTVDDEFPRLTTDDLRSALDRRISAIRYTVDLSDIDSEEFEDISLEEYR